MKKRLEEGENVAHLNEFIYKIRFVKRGDITEELTELQRLEAIFERLKTQSPLEQRRAIDALEQSGKQTWVERTAPKPTADVHLPEVPPELWEGSKEQQRVTVGEMSLDEAVPAFTARVYSGFLPGQQPVGIAITDFKDGDRPLYDEWVSLKKRINSRKDNIWPDEYPFSSRKARNDFVFEQLEAGNLLPPEDHRFYASLKSALLTRHEVNIDEYRTQGTKQANC